MLGKASRVPRRCFSLVAPKPEPSIMDMLFNRSSMPRVALSEPFPATSAPKPAEIAKHSVQVSTLDNGLRVVSRSSQSPVASVGVFVDAGSRFENPQNQGVSHFLEYFAFASTKTLPDYKLVRDMQKIGATFACSTAREHTMYVADCLREDTPRVFQTLADVTQNPDFADYELEEARESYSELLQDKLTRPDVILTEAIHAAAYHNNTVGLPLYPTEEGLNRFDDKLLNAYFKQFFIPQRMVVCGVGADHAEFVKLAQKYFTAPRGQDPTPGVANYTGGEVRVSNPDIPTVHVSLAFESASWKSKDVFALCVLQLIMGGGGSFSAGGPGKGMCSRLYANVLNQYEWVESAQSFDNIYTDTSLFGITGICGAEQGSEIIDVLVHQFHNMTRIEGPELERAKNQLKVGLLIQLESRAMQFEDLGRQLLTYNKIQSAEELCAAIDAVSAADVARVASTMLKRKPSLALYGNLHRVPRYEEVAKRFG